MFFRVTVTCRSIVTRMFVQMTDWTFVFERNAIVMR